MEKLKIRAGAALVALIGWLALAAPGRAADIREFIHDTQQTANQGSTITLVWWIPPEFWQVSLAANGSVPPDQVSQVIAAVRDYQIFALVRASTGIQGLTEMQSKAELVSNAHLEIGGKPIIRGRRLAVEHVLGMLAAGDTPETILEGYPWLEPGDIQACLVYARRLVSHERVEPLVLEQTP